MHVINVCFRRSHRWGGVYAFCSKFSARLPFSPYTEDKLFVSHLMYKWWCSWSQSILTFYLSLRVTRSETVKPVAAACVWRASDVRVWEGESVHMRYVNWHTGTEAGTPISLTFRRITQSTASLQQWLAEYQFLCMVLRKRFRGSYSSDTAISTVIESDSLLRQDDRHLCWGARDGTMARTWSISNTNMLRGMLCFGVKCECVYSPLEEDM